MKEKRRKRQQRQRILIFSIIAVVALFVVGVAVVPNLLPSNVKPITPDPRPQANANSMGDPNAPVKIVEFSDFQCPYCRQYAEEIEPQMVEQYIKTGKVYFTYRSAGEWIGPESVAAAEAAYCAGDQNRFWDYHDVLFTNWNGENLGSFSSKHLQDFAKYLKLDMSQFNSCVNSHKYGNQVSQDNADALKQKIQGTPSFIINGQLYNGPLSFAGFKQVIDAQLSASK